MNKKILFSAAAILFCGYFALVSFKGKTKEQQMQEIATAVETKISDLRASKTAECDARVTASAQIKFDSIQTAEAEAAAAAAAKSGKKGITKKVTKKKTTKTSVTPTAPRVDPMPTTTPPPAANPKENKMKQVENTVEKAEKMTTTPNTDKKASKMKSGGGN